MSLQCPGEVVTGASGEALCLDEFGAAVEWVYVAPFHLDAVEMAEPFFVGFSLMFACWALGKGVAVVVDLVRR